MGTLIKENAKSYKIRMEYPDFSVHPARTHTVDRLVPKIKCAMPEELVCIVWDTDTGANGRGSYYIERSLYPEYRIKANLIARQSFGAGRVTKRNGIIGSNF